MSRANTKHVLSDSAVVYGSDLIVADGTELATLCVCYEKVQLPYVLGWDGQPPPPPRELAPGWHARRTAVWDSQVAQLYQSGVLHRLPRPDPGNVLVPASRQEWFDQMQLANFIQTEMPVQMSLDVHDLTLHYLRTDLPSPMLLSPFEQDCSYRTLKAVEARTIFNYLIPALSPLAPDDILAARELVADVREGFSMHLQKLTSSLCSASRAGTPKQEIARLADELIATEIMPDYAEFRRKLTAVRAGRARRWLARSKSVLSINASPTTPKFWCEFLARIGLSTLETVEEQADYHSNKNQTLWFMKRIEDTFGRPKGQA